MRNDTSESSEGEKTRKRALIKGDDESGSMKEKGKRQRGGAFLCVHY